MIEALKDDTIIDKVGGRFKLASMIHKRYSEILQGSRPLIKRGEGMTDLETIIQEIVEGKIAIDYANSDILTPDKMK
jgi:DNA-directed RNA polymerase subunit omega